jgi:hypothetical protein
MVAPGSYMQQYSPVQQVVNSCAFLCFMLASARMLGLGAQEAVNVVSRCMPSS